MEDFSLNLNLRKLKSHVMKLKSKSGMIDCVILPIEANHFVVTGDNFNAIYMDLNGIVIKNPAPNSKNTHLVKQQLPKDVYANLSESEKKDLPIVGNAIVWEARASAPNDFPLEVPIVATDNSFSDQPDDLPF